MTADESDSTKKPRAVREPSATGGERDEAGRRQPAPAVNAIQATRRRRKGAVRAGVAAPVSESAPRKGTTSEAGERPGDGDPWTVPQSVRDRFIQDGHRFYFPDGAPAFKDLGRRLTTASENTQVVRSLIEIAHSRGWSEVTVSGTERFRQEAWRQARLEGLAVRGYRPTEVEQAQLVRALARTLTNPTERGDTVSVDPRPTPEPPRGPDATVNPGGPRLPERFAGRLLEHGRDHYRHDPGEALSYFVRLETAQGPREVWGKDIERAVARSLSQPKIGEQVILQRNGRIPVTVRRTERAGDGGVTERPVETFRNQWVIEKQEFLLERAQTAQIVRNAAIEPKEAVRQRPELAGTYVALRAATLSARSLRDPEDQTRFVSRVRQALADGIQSGEPLLTVRLRERREPRAPPNRALEARENAR